MIVALIALIVALGGTSYAAFRLPKNSVGSKQLKKNAVTTAKIKNGAVTGAKVARQSLTGANIVASSLGQVPNAIHANSADSATNASQLGGIGASSYLSRYERVVGTASAMDATQVKFVPVSCPTGKKLLSLGVAEIVYFGNLPAIIPQFTNDTSGEIIAQKDDGMTYSVTPEAVCAAG
jgi:hypothetical protein